MRASFLLSKGKHRAQLIQGSTEDEMASTIPCLSVTRLMVAFVVLALSFSTANAECLVCPSDITMNPQLGDCSALVYYEVESCEGASVSLTTGLPSGSTFPPGRTIVIYEGTEANGMPTDCTFSVNVPLVTCPSDIIVTTDQAMVDYSVTFCGSVIKQKFGLPSDSIFPVGLTENVFEVSDMSGHNDTCSFEVYVSIQCPPNIVVPAAANECFAVVEYDIVEQDVMVVGMPSGSEFPVGTTTVTLEHREKINGNPISSCSFDVVVYDDQQPSILCPDSIEVEAGRCESALVEYTLMTDPANDNCQVDVLSRTIDGETDIVNVPGNEPISWTSKSIFPIGTTTGVFEVFDGAWNSALCSFEVTVVPGPEGPPVTCSITTDDVNSFHYIVEWSGGGACAVEAIVEPSCLDDIEVQTSGTVLELDEILDCARKNDSPRDLHDDVKLIIKEEGSGKVVCRAKPVVPAQTDERSEENEEQLFVNGSSESGGIEENIVFIGVSS